MANVIYRGPVSREPETVNLPVVGTLLPGTVVNIADDTLTQAADATGRLLILSNRRFYGQGPDDAYAALDTGVAYRTESDQEYQARFAAGTYERGDPLSVASGRVKAAVGGEVVVAYYDGAGATLAAGDRDDIVIATNTYVVPAA